MSMRKVRKSFSAATGMSFSKSKAQRQSEQPPVGEGRESEYVEDPQAFSAVKPSPAAAAAEPPLSPAPVKSAQARPAAAAASLPEAAVSSEVVPAGPAAQPVAGSGPSSPAGAAAAAGGATPVEAVTAKKESASPTKAIASSQSFRATQHPKKHALDDHVHLSFEAGPLGINVRQGNGALVVSKVNASGPAAGLIAEGYTISMLNDNDVESHLTLRQFKTMVHSSVRPLKLSFAPPKPATDGAMDGGQRRANRGVMAAWTCCLSDQDAQPPTQAPPTAEVTMSMSSGSAGTVATLASS